MLTSERAYQKLKYYCSYRERCHYEVKEKLFGLGLSKTLVESLLSRLIEEDYLNEERYAVQFAGGHFRIRQWGKRKIRAALQQKRVSEANIRIGLRSIESGDYEATLQKLTKARWDFLRKEQYLNRMAKTTAYLLQKGYEPSHIQPVIAAIRAAEK